jgi:hypothetical protein
MRTLLLVLFSVVLRAASPCAALSNVCLINIPGDYTTAQLQTAINDGVTYQDTSMQCSPYVIQIAAGTVITGNMLFAPKTCHQYLEVRSSGCPSISGRVNPTTQSALLATIQSPNNGQTLGTSSSAGASYYAFRCLKLTLVPKETGYPYVVAIVGNANTGNFPTDNPDHWEIDRCWITGVPNEEGPDEALYITGSNINVHDSWIDYGHSSYFDSQGTLINNALNVSFVNNYTSGAAENLFIFQNQPNINIDTHGNYSYKPFTWKWSYGTTAPTGTCFYDANGGERYTQFANAFTGALNVTSAVNNGSGLIRVTTSPAIATLTTGDQVQITNGFLAGGNLGIWTVTVISGGATSVFDLQGSTFSGTFSGEGIVQKITQLWYCNAGTWTTTSSLFASNYYIKNEWEAKSGNYIKAYGNFFANAWPGAQYETATINQVNTPNTISNVSWYANKAINANEGFIIGGLGVVAPFGVSNVNFHDNLWPSVSIYQTPGFNQDLMVISPGSEYATTITATAMTLSATSVTLAVGTGLYWAVGMDLLATDTGEQMLVTNVTGDTLTVVRGYLSTTPASHNMGAIFNALAPLQNITIRHNTILSRTDSFEAGFQTNFPGGFTGPSVMSDNLISSSYEGLTNLNNNISKGWCQWENANLQPGTLFGHNIWSTVDQPGFESGGQMLTFASSPNCSSGDYNFVFTLTDTWLHTPDYSTVFTTTAGDINTWDYHCLSSYAPCHNAGSDGRDIGADITLVNTATAHAVDGAPNPFFDMQFKAKWVYAVTGITVSYVAPTTAACTFTLYSDEAHTTSVFTNTDSGGNPARTVSTGGIAAGIKFPLLSCASGAYVLSASAGLVPIVVH